MKRILAYRRFQTACIAAGLSAQTKAGCLNGREKKRNRQIGIEALF